MICELIAFFIFSFWLGVLLLILFHIHRVVLLMVSFLLEFVWLSTAFLVCISFRILNIFFLSSLENIIFYQLCWFRLGYFVDGFYCSLQHFIFLVFNTNSFWYNCILWFFLDILSGFCEWILDWHLQVRLWFKFVGMYWPFVSYHF